MFRFYKSKILKWHRAAWTDAAILPLQGAEADQLLHVRLSLDVTTADGVRLQAGERQHIKVIQHRSERHCGGNADLPVSIENPVKYLSSTTCQQVTKLNTSVNN